MGYRLDYSVSGGVLMVTISGSCPTPGAIARDIGREARENAVRNVLVDVRRLQDRIGKIRDLLAEKDGPKRIAVLDNVLNERLYVFAEIDARARGCASTRKPKRYAGWREPAKKERARRSSGSGKRRSCRRPIRASRPHP